MRFPRIQSILLTLAFIGALSFTPHARAEAGGKTVKAGIDALASYVVLKGWDVEEGTDMAEPALYMTRGHDGCQALYRRLRVRGGAGLAAGNKGYRIIRFGTLEGNIYCVLPT